MQIKIDIKSLVFGLVLGVVVFLAMGQVSGGAGETDYGLAVERSGFAIVRDKNNVIYVVDPQRERAMFVQYDSGLYKGRAMDLDLDVTTPQRQ
jgi:hypothetical protein